MAFFNKQDMLYDDYNWSDYQKNDPRVSAPVKADMKFNRSEGPEVLFIVNLVIEELMLQSKSSCFKLERMIRNHLPYNVAMQSEVKDWLKRNWQHF